MIALMGLLRTSEFLVENKKKPDLVRLLTVADVSWHPNYRECQWIKLSIRASKTDFWREGVEIVIGKTGDPSFCAVSELQIALEDRFGGPLGETEWRMSEPLFMVNGFPLSKERSALTLKRVTKALGWDPSEYGLGLSLRNIQYYRIRRPAHELFVPEGGRFFDGLEGEFGNPEGDGQVEIRCVPIHTRV